MVESPLIGKTHPDTFRHDDEKQLKLKFKDDVLPQIRAIEVYHDGRFVFGYEFFYQGNV